MPYTLDWLLENRILLLKNIGTISVEDLRQQNSEIIDFLDAMPETVHLIVDLSATENLPALKAAGEIKFTRHPRYGIGVAVGHMNPLVKTLSIVLANILGLPFYNKETLEQALAVLYAMDSTIPPIPSQAE